MRDSRLKIIGLTAMAHCLLAQPVWAKQISLTVTNPLAVRRVDAPVVVSMAALRKAAPGLADSGFILSSRPVSEPNPGFLPSQADDLNGDGKADELAFVLDLGPKERRVITLTYGENTPRAKFVVRARAMYAQKYEGMGWESDRVAWRLYFDKRNAIDLYGKHQHSLSLDYFAQPGVNYHKESPQGRDIFKNGDAIGLGSIAAYVGGRPVKVADVETRTWKVVADGPVRAIADLHYKGWKVDGKSVNLTSRLTIWAGQHWFEHSVSAEKGNGLQFVTGLPIKPRVTVVRASASEAHPAYLATWGKQVLREGATAVAALPDRNLGLAIMLPRGVNAKAMPRDPLDTLVSVPLSGAGKTHFYVMGVWDGEAPENISGGDPALRLPAVLRSSASWQRYVAATSRAISSPPRVQIQTKISYSSEPAR